MSNPDDFDILTEDPQEPGRPTRLWLWLLIAASAIFVFAVGMALATFTNRLNGNDPALPDGTVQAGIATYTATAPAGWHPHHNGSVISHS
ncbi:MAG: hypothetical protein R2867_12275 [Caldilineaceae bacterium]